MTDPEINLTSELDGAEAIVMGTDTAQGTPWSLGVRCDTPDCGTCFEGDFLVAEDSTRDERLRVVLDWVEKHGWHVDWRRPVGASLTYCPACSATGDQP